MPKIISQEEWDRRANRAGLVWLTKVERAIVHTLAECVACGYEWSPIPNNVLKGRGCPMCAGQIVTQEDWDRRAEAVGIAWLEPVVLGTIHAMAECTSCGKQKRQLPADINQGLRMMCPCRDPRRVSQREWDDRAAKIGLEWIEEVRSADTMTIARCITCGAERKQRPSHVTNGIGIRCQCSWSRTIKSRKLEDAEWQRRAKKVGLVITSGIDSTEVFVSCLSCMKQWATTKGSISNGSGCPSCVKYGFDMDHPACVYLLADTGSSMMKIGISNKSLDEKDSRIRKHKRRGWNVVHIWQFSKGSDARDVEQSVLNHWRDRDARFANREDVPAGDGFTETVLIGRVDIPETIRVVEDMMLVAA